MGLWGPIQIQTTAGRPGHSLQCGPGGVMDTPARVSLASHWLYMEVGGEKLRETRNQGLCLIRAPREGTLEGLATLITREASRGRKCVSSLCVGAL